VAKLASATVRATNVAGTAAPARPAATPAARSIASASMPMSPAASAAAPPSVPQMAAQGLTQQPAEPVAMNQLFRSAPPGTGTPEHAFMSQAAQFQHQITQGRGTNGAVLNNRAVPLELSSNLLPVMPAGGHLALGPGVAAEAGQAGVAGAAAGQAQAPKPASPTAPDQAAIAQKMIDALNKYQVLKKQEEQQDSAEKPDRAKLDLSL
jgi:hypothetical protein